MVDREAKYGNRVSRTVQVSEEDASMIRKVRRILASGKEAWIKSGKDGEAKVLRISKELE